MVTLKPPENAEKHRESFSLTSTGDSLAYEKSSTLYSDGDAKIKTYHFLVDLSASYINRFRSGASGQSKSGGYSQR
jgi:hypothetical protein